MYKHAITKSLIVSCYDCLSYVHNTLIHNGLFYAYHDSCASIYPWTREKIGAEQLHLKGIYKSH